MCRARLSLVALAVIASCTTAPQAPPRHASAPAATATGDELFSAGRYTDAVAAYRAELERGVDVAELRTVLAFARTAAAERDWAPLDELRAIERTYPRSRWGHIAAVLADEIDRATVLRQAVMAAGADLRDTQQQRAEGLQRETAQAAQLAEQQATITALREERGRLQQVVRETEERATAADARVRELEAELAALKQVDMQRAP